MLKLFKSAGGVRISCEQHDLPYVHAIESLIDQLDTQRGVLLTSNFEYPGRYTCWDLGFYNPPLVLVCKAEKIEIQALNQRGEVLLAMIVSQLSTLPIFLIQSQSIHSCQLELKPSQAIFNEEERSQQPSVFTLIRQILAFFKTDDEPYLGLYGAFGYDLIFQFELLAQCKRRAADQRDMVLYFPDEIYIVNHRKEQAFIRRYDFQYQNQTTDSLPREGASQPYQAKYQPQDFCDHALGEYVQVVELAKQRFACGDLFEVVPSQTFYETCTEQPSALFRRIRQANPSPYGFLMNLGDEEYLVGASPEMYVRVQGKRVETCPISGTVQRGADALEDASNIQHLLESEKEASELTMCTDVDRNDKSRICEAGSVRVLGRRQIEMYSRVIHTVDHVEGILREGFDAVDAFLTHMWVVTVTGAPKLWAMNFIEQHEKSPRRWYAGAVGWFGFNGDLNTGLVLRTLRIQQGIAEIRAGATLLFDSDPNAEEQETRLKASAFLQQLNQSEEKVDSKQCSPGIGKRVLLVDHQDSFVHTLANYVRQTGAEVMTMRSEHVLDYLEKQSFDLVILSPGPGRPKDFKVQKTIQAVLARQIPLFGVCLGLQGIVEYFGGQLDVLDYPMHGKASEIQVKQASPLFTGMNSTFIAGRYHSLYARLESMPAELVVTALSKEGIVMAVSHKTLPIHAVQFHPETILSMPNQVGLNIIRNLMNLLIVHHDAIPTP